MKRITMDLKSQTQSERVKIRIEYNGELQFCDVGLTNLTKQSFLRDGEHYHSLLYIWLLLV